MSSPAFILVVMMITGVAPPHTLAQVATNITASGLGTNVRPNAIDPAITEIRGGTRPGNGANLFQSFGDFSVAAGEVAHFLNQQVDALGAPIPNSGLPTTNILGRVTAGNISQIFGTLRTNGADASTNFGNASLFLMNPAGFLFGPNATVNVGGMVAFTTADYLRLTGGVRFEAAIPSAQDALLSAMPVAAFGFLGSNPGAITVEGSQLSVSTGQSIALAGGNIEIRAGTLEDGSTQSARLSAPNGQIKMASAASPGEFLLPNLQRAPNVDGEAFTSVGAITLAAGSTVDVSGTSTVSIRGGQFVLSVNDAVLTTTASPGAQDTVALGTGSVISTRTDGVDPGSDIQIVASSVQMDGARIQSSTFGEGPGGGISIDGQSMNLSNGAFIRSTAEGLGLGGAVNINVSSVTIDGASIFSFVSPSDFVVDETPGPALTFNVDDLNIQAGGFVAAESLNIFGEGPPIISGTITINAADTVTVSGTSPGGQRSRIESRTDSGAVGDIVIDTGTLLVKQGARINSEEVLGLAGRILITAESVTVADGAKIRMEGTDVGGGSMEITAPTITIDQAILQTVTTGTGDAASISLIADNVTLSGGQINSQTEQIIGRGGDVTITAQDTLTVAGQFAGNEIDPAGPAGIFTGTLNLGGDAGKVSATVGTLEMSGGAQFNSSTSSLGSDPVPPFTTEPTSGLGGDLTIIAANGVSLSGPGTGLFSETSGPWSGGNITVRSNQASFSDGAIASAKSTGPGKAGEVTIEGTASPAQSVVIDGAGSGIFTDTQGTGAGGNINLFAQSFTVQNGATLSATTSGTEASATGGTILVNAIVQGDTIMPTAAQSATLSNGASISATSTGPANAGDIVINGGQTYTSTNSSVTTQATAPGTEASGGNITVLATDMVQLTNSQINASVQGSTTTIGGTIVIDPQFVILQNSQILATATQGQGGNITITGGVVLIDPSSTINASSQFGVNGQVSIQSPVQNISTSLAPLPKNFQSAAALLAQRCAARASEGQFSTFVVAGRETALVEPGGLLPSPAGLGGPVVAASGAKAGLFASAASRSADLAAVPLRLAALEEECTP